MGYVPSEEKHDLTRGASVLCYPSRFEGFGLPPLEAMSFGVPVVAANTPAVAEVTGGAALLANPDDPSAWTQALERILRKTEEAAGLRAAGLARSDLFTWERCAQQTVRLYKRVAAMDN